MILGVVLAGGESRRFGSDKSGATLGGRPLIQHAIDALAPHVDAVAISGARFGDLPTIGDRPRPGLGPLGGLAGALRYAGENGFDAVLTVPCDTPLLAPELLRGLMAHGPAVVAELPVCGFWPASLSNVLDEHLAVTDNLSMRRWADVAHAALIPAGAPIANVNTPDDLSALE